MKKNYLLTLLITLCLSSLSFAQTTLSAGDIVVIELKGDTDDAFRFVPLVDLEAGTVIKFTDNRWDGTALTDNEGTIVYTAPTGGVTAGKNISFDNGNVAAEFDTTDNIALSTSGDQILVYQGEKASPTFIFAVQSNSTLWQDPSTGTKQSNLPQGLTDGVNAVAAGQGIGNESEWDNIYYSGITTGAKADLLAAVANAANWTGDNTSSSPITSNFTVTANSVTSITINSPSDNTVFPSTTTQVPVTLSITNFTLSGDAGGGVSDNKGDGYIKGTLNEVGGTSEPKNVFSTSPDPINVSVGKMYTLTAELVDNTGNSLSPAVSKTVNFSVAFPCDLMLSSIATTCDALTSGTDTYNGTIAFTGGNTGISYTITAPSGVTVGGDNPNTVADGTITFSGMTEGTNAEIKIVGGAGSSCDLSRTLFSPTCVSFPITENFDYTDGANLGDQTSWTKLNSGDDMLVADGNLDYAGLRASTGNKIKFDETGSETYTAFSDVTSGTVYASFLLKVTSFQTGTNPDTTDGAYIAALAGSTSSYDARFWVRPNPDTNGTTFDIGFGAESSKPPFTTGTYNLNDVLFVVMGYNMDDGTISTWVNPDAGSFGGKAPTTTLSSIDEGKPSAINLFVLRQDSNNETPFIELDALRISTSWADVTPKEGTASINSNSIIGFATYPNPITDKRFTITTNSSDTKQAAIFNVLGKKVLTTSFSAAKKEINVSNINSGIYILKVTENGKTATKKLVIR